MWIRSLVLVAWTFVSVSQVSAQEPGDGRASCLRGGTPETCQTFWITEFGASMPLDGGGTEDLQLTWALGVMGRVSPAGAFGASAFLSVDGGPQGLLVGVRPRYRHWLRSTTLDVAVGLYKRIERTGGPGVTSQVALGLTDWIAITTQVDFFGSTRCAERGDYGRCFLREAFTDKIWYGGARLSSVPGVVTGLLAPIVAGIAVVIMCASGCGL